MTSHTSDLKQQIERILHWEQSSYWRSQDFVFLSERIVVHTNCWVEPLDLEMFWRSSEATPGLLDALAQFIDYTDWPDFCDCNQSSEMVPINPDLFHTRIREIPVRWVSIIYCIAILASAAVAILLVWKH